MSFWGGIAQAVGIAAGTPYGPIGAHIGLSAANFAIDKFTPQPKTSATGALRPVGRPAPQTNASKFGQMLAQNAGGLYQAYQSNKVTKNAANSVLQGGIMDRDQRNLELSMQDPAYIRQQFEAAGFNPLLGIGNALKGLGYGPTMGQNMANAASIQADGFHKSQLLEVQRTELDMENRRLNAQIQNMSLNRQVGGVYSRNRSTLGGSNANKSWLGSAHLAPTFIDPPERERLQKYVDVWDSDINKWISIVNPELTESGPLEMATGLGTLSAAAAYRYPKVITNPSTATSKGSPFDNFVKTLNGYVDHRDLPKNKARKKYPPSSGSSPLKMDIY